MPSQVSTFTLWQLPNQTHTQMMSYVLRTVHGKVVVIDGGTEGDAAYLKDFLAKLGNEVEVWVVTHPHLDHVTALGEILSDPGDLVIKKMYGSMPEKAWVSENCSELENGTYDRFVAAVMSAKMEIIDLSPGQDFLIDGMHIRVLGIRNPEITGNPLNNSSVVLKVWDEKKSVLFTGDLGVEGGEKLLKSAYADDLPADYVQMAHHGQNGVGKSFYEKVNAKYCLWPTPKWLWDNDTGSGKGSGPWRTLEVRAWMEELNIKTHFVMWEGLHEIQ